LTTKDLFSANAPQYAAFRPDYPKALYDFIFNYVKNFSTAWDCATGNGQAARELSSRFKQVYATDISEKQMLNGHQASNILYSISPAEQTNFPDNFFDFIAVAQAVHWFRLDKFYDEVKRVAKPKSVLAIWGYGLLSINPEFDQKILTFYKEVVGPYWDTERKLIDESYQTIPFSFREIQSPGISFTKQWNIQHLQGYLSTWSAVQKYIKANGHDPVSEFIDESTGSFGSGVQEIKFPLFLRLGVVKE
jgi:SAM-dependent methyltransferase